jgi:hypothetical protein
METNRSRPSFCASFPHGNGYVLVFTKHGLAYILGEFSTNSSGRPATGATTNHASNDDKACPTTR